MHVRSAVNRCAGHDTSNLGDNAARGGGGGGRKSVYETPSFNTIELEERITNLLLKLKSDLKSSD